VQDVFIHDGKLLDGIINPNRLFRQAKVPPEP
jgi:hypothetical protein